MIVYRGPSLLDGGPIVVIATGLGARSKNAKTGDMVQVYILREDMRPMDALRVGADASICGDCIHRGDGTGRKRTCYVNIAFGLDQTWRAYQRGKYPVVTLDEAADAVAGRMVRLGAYGDPAAVPIMVWHTLLSRVDGWTGYTHAWKSLTSDWATLCMASVDTLAEAMEAQARGWRTFRVGDDPVPKLEINCPASIEAGAKVQCADCRACMGTAAKARVNIQIRPHGKNARTMRSVA